MANLGAVGKTSLLGTRFMCTRGHGPTKALWTGTMGLSFNGGRDDVQGTPAPPSLRLEHLGFWGPIIWPILEPGTHSFTVSMKWGVRETTLPRLHIRQSAEVGVPTDLVATATGNADEWNTVAISFTCAGAGALEVLFEKRTDGTNNIMYVDKIVTT